MNHLPAVTLWAKSRAVACLVVAFSAPCDGREQGGDGL